MSKSMFGASGHQISVSDFADFDTRILMASSGGGGLHRRLDAIVAFNERDGVIARYRVRIGSRESHFDSLGLAIAHYNEAPDA